MIDLESYSYSKSRHSINRSCTNLLPCWYVPPRLCVWENKLPLIFFFLNHKPPCWDSWWVYQMMPIQVLCQWPDIWIGHDNLQVTQLVLGSWRKPLNIVLYWVCLLDTGLFLFFSSQAGMKSTYEFSERCTEWQKAHKSPVPSPVSDPTTGR